VRRTRTTIGLATFAVAALILSACGDDSDSSDAAGPSGEVGAHDLAAAGCPDTEVIQTDWNPEAEHGGVYQLLGNDPSINADDKSVTGTLVDSDGDSTGVLVQIRAGGPAIGFQQVTAQMYSDDSITMGYVGTDESIAFSADQPTTGVLAPLEISPQMVMWDPETYPDVTGIADLGRQNVSVRTFEGSTWVSYLEGAGILNADQVDESYDGSPGAFVAAAGEDAQQGFASSEPYNYEHEIDDWGKPVKYQLTYDVGYQPYASAIAVRTGDLEPLDGCLKELVPIMQQADVDYLADPGDVNDLILDLVEKYDTGWQYSQGNADYALQTMVDDGLVGDGPDGTHGNFDPQRVQELIDKTTPIFTEQGTAPADGLTVDDVAVNTYIDPSISVGAAG
jgi:hypothetical protein